MAILVYGPVLGAGGGQAFSGGSQPSFSFALQIPLETFGIVEVQVMHLWWKLCEHDLPSHRPHGPLMTLGEPPK